MEFSLDFHRGWSGQSGLGGTHKATPADFVVEEKMSEAFTGNGEHLYLKVRKTGQNTHWVAEQLANLAGVRAREVGYAGRKDRYAVTTQWFSVPTARNLDDISSIEGCELLEAQRHIRKLRPGDHDTNLFNIRVTALRGDADLRSQILDQITAHGFPNYFGTQRFGRDGNNLQRGWESVSLGRRLKGRQSGIYLSAMRSWLFNCIVDRHIRNGDWDAICQSPSSWTGPLWGRGRNQPSELEENIEFAVAQENSALCDYLEHAGLNQERREVLAKPHQFRVLAHTAEYLDLEFELEKGQFATELLAEIGVAEFR